MTVTPLKCGMKVDSPAFIMVYKDDNNKIRKRIMPLRNFKIDSNVKFVAEELRKRHELNIPIVKIEKILRLLQELIKGVDKKEAIMEIEKEFTIRVNEDLNKLPTDEIEFQKQLMDTVFTKNQIKTDSDDFVYDKQVDFNADKEESNWDDEDKEDSFWG